MKVGEKAGALKAIERKEVTAAMKAILRSLAHLAKAYSPKYLEDEFSDIYIQDVE